MIDILRLKEFYETPAGLRCCSLLHHHLSFIIPPSFSSFLGVGYVFPYLDHPLFETFIQKKGQGAILTTENMGAFPWPSKEQNQVSLINPHNWPIPDQSIDFIFLAHSLEHTPHPTLFLREAWRVLRNEGRLMALVPNRRGLWARSEKTPFGYGHPYSRPQLIGIFQENFFSDLIVQECLYMPPFQFSTSLSMATTWEKIGSRIFQTLGGAFLILGTKSLYAGIAVEKNSWAPYVPILNKDKI